MIRTIMIATLLAAVTAGCANGWPHVRHEKSSTMSNCGYTGTRIPRSGCDSAPPTQGMSGEDIDRGMAYPVPSAITPLPTKGPH